MGKRTLVGLCAALAFTVGSPAVHALKIVDEINDDPTGSDARDSNIYARETLTGATQAASDSTDMTTYRTISEQRIIVGTKDVVQAGVNDSYTVTISLEGMVFAQTQNPGGVASMSGALDAVAGTQPAFTLLVGGRPGDRSATFQFQNDGLNTITPGTDTLYLDAAYAVANAEMDDGSGTRMTMTMRNLTLEGLDIPAQRTVEATGLLRFASGLMETADPRNPTATAEHGYRSFGGSSVATVGGLQVGYDAALRDAGVMADDTTTTDINELLVTGLGQLVDTTAGASTVIIDGDFSFATSAYLHETADCMTTGGALPVTAVAPGILDMGDDGMVTGVNDQDVADFTTKKFLCIVVDPTDEDLSIPETSSYLMTIEYVAVTADPPRFVNPEPADLELGMIMRDGTEVHIPYLTTYEGYNQRIVLSNRGDEEATYEMTFRPEDGVTATGKDMAMGTLMPNSVMTYKATDLVMLEGGSRTAATITMEVPPSNIGVTSVIVNKESGDTDTVVHQ